MKLSSQAKRTNLFLQESSETALLKACLQDWPQLAPGNLQKARFLKSSHHQLIDKKGSLCLTYECKQNGYARHLFSVSESGTMYIHASHGAFYFCDGHQALQAATNNFIVTQEHCHNFLENQMWLYREKLYLVSPKIHPIDLVLLLILLSIFLL